MCTLADRDPTAIEVFRSCLIKAALVCRSRTRTFNLRATGDAYAYSLATPGRHHNWAAAAPGDVAMAAPAGVMPITTGVDPKHTNCKSVAAPNCVGESIATLADSLLARMRVL